MVKPQTSLKSRPRVQRGVNDNYCVLSVAGVKDSVHVSGKRKDLNPSPVTSKSETVFLHVNSSVANVHSVTGYESLATKTNLESDTSHTWFRTQTVTHARTTQPIAV